MEHIRVAQISAVAVSRPPLPLSPMQKIIRSKVCGVASGDSCGSSFMDGWYVKDPHGPIHIG